MPVRRTVVTRMVEHAHGGPWVWNGATGECLSDGWSADRHDAATAEMDQLFAVAVDTVDWDRILILAQGVCIDAGHDHDWGPPAQVCPDAIRQALLQTDR